MVAAAHLSDRPIGGLQPLARGGAFLRGTPFAGAFRRAASRPAGRPSCGAASGFLLSGGLLGGREAGRALLQRLRGSYGQRSRNVSSQI